MKLERLIALSIAVLVTGGALVVHADKDGRSDQAKHGAKQKDKESKARDSSADHDNGRGNDKDKGEKDRHDNGLHLGHYKNGKVEEGAPATRPSATPVQSTPAAPAPTPVAQNPAPATPAPVQPTPGKVPNAAAEARRLEQIVREIRQAARERDADLDEAYAVASKEHRPTKFEERRDKILAKYEALVLRLLGREELIARLADNQADRREAKAPAQKPEVSKGSSKRELEMAREVVELRAKLRGIDAEIADEKDDSADRLETLQAARKRFEFKRDWEEVRRIDGLIASEKEAFQKRIASLDRQRSAAALELTRTQKQLAELRRENEDDDSARRRVADLDRQISDRKHRVAGAD